MTDVRPIAAYNLAGHRQDADNPRGHSFGVGTVDGVREFFEQRIDERALDHGYTRVLLHNPAGNPETWPAERSMSIDQFRSLDPLVTEAWASGIAERPETEFILYLGTVDHEVLDDPGERWSLDGVLRETAVAMRPLRALPNVRFAFDAASRYTKDRPNAEVCRRFAQSLGSYFEPATPFREWYDGSPIITLERQWRNASWRVRPGISKWPIDVRDVLRWNKYIGKDQGKFAEWLTAVGSEGHTPVVHWIEAEDEMGRVENVLAMMSGRG